MLKKFNYNDMGVSDIPWLDTKFHFSFANYYNPNNINFGALRVLNDDIIASESGFDTHPHQNMEIVTYVVEGNLSHKDSMSNERTLSRGEVQYMSAGTGVLHSEHNHTKEPLRLLQIWIFPDQDGYQPNYGDYSFTKDQRHNKLLNIVSSPTGKAPIKIHQDMNIYVSELDKDKAIDFKVSETRQAYFMLIEGKVMVNDIELNHGDALEIIEEDINIKSLENSHFIILEMMKE